MTSTVMIKVNLATIENGNAEMLLNEVKSFLKRGRCKITIKEARKRLINYLSKNNLDLTEERNKTIDIIFSIDSRFTVKDLKNRIPLGYSISSGTLYNTIKLFLKANIIELSDIGMTNQSLTRYFELTQMD